MKSDNVIVTIAVVAVLASFAGLLMNYGNFSNFNNLFTGFATEEGTVNVTIDSTTSILIVSANGTEGKALNWGEGAVDTNRPFALLVSNGTVVDGSWPVINEGFIINNTGNTNVNLTIQCNTNADTFIGGNDPEFQFNISNNLPNSCAAVAEGYTLGTYTDFLTTAVPVCDNFTSDDAADQLRMDVLVKIPSSAQGSETEATVTLNYEAVA